MAKILERAQERPIRNLPSRQSSHLCDLRVLVLMVWTSGARTFPNVADVWLDWPSPDPSVDATESLPSMYTPQTDAISEAPPPADNARVHTIDTASSPTCICPSLLTIKRESPDAQLQLEDPDPGLDIFDSMLVGATTFNANDVLDPYKEGFLGNLKDAGLMTWPIDCRNEVVSGAATHRRILDWLSRM